MILTVLLQSKLHDAPGRAGTRGCEMIRASVISKWVRQHNLVIPALEKLRQENQEFKVIFCYTVSSRGHLGLQETLSQKQTNRRKDYMYRRTLSISYLLTLELPISSCRYQFPTVPQLKLRSQKLLPASMLEYWLDWSFVGLLQPNTAAVSSWVQGPAMPRRHDFEDVWPSLWLL